MVCCHYMLYNPHMTKLYNNAVTLNSDTPRRWLKTTTETRSSTFYSSYAQFAGYKLVL